MQLFYRGACVCKASNGPVRAGVSCAAVGSGVHVLSTHRDMVAFGLYLNRGAGILSGGVCVQGQYRPARENAANILTRWARSQKLETRTDDQRSWPRLSATTPVAATALTAATSQRKRGSAKEHMKVNKSV
jgi:hypothetical protein